MASAFLSRAFAAAVGMSAAASWMIVAVLLLRPALKRAPRAIVCLLWLLVAVRLVCPFSIESSLSVIPQLRPAAGGAVYAAQAPGPFGADNAAPAEDDAGPAEPFAQPGRENNAPRDAGVFPLLWAAGMAGMAAAAAAGQLRLRKRVGMSVPQGDDILLCDTIPSPFILGVLKPKIYLPSGMTGAARCHALAHERAHLSRGDHLWKPLGYCILTVHWFNPLCWIGFALLCRDIEFACDERVIRGLDFEGRRAYSQALLDCSAGRHRAAACPLAFGEVDVGRRVKGILRYKRPSRRSLAVSSAVCVAAALCLLTDPPRVAASGNDAPAAQIQSQQTAGSETAGARHTGADAAGWVWPTRSADISARYGDRVDTPTGEALFVDHLNIRAEHGDDVFAAADGAVSEVAFDAEYGRYVVVRCDDGVNIVYGHLDEVSVSPGSRVRAGQRIGSVGKTGRAASDCLLFLVYDADGTLDPLQYYG